MMKICETVDRIASECSEKILCCYINPTKLLQIVRIKNTSNKNFEKVIFPGQRLLFEAGREAQMEIHTGMADGTVIGLVIKCDRLRVFEGLQSD